MKLRHPFLIRSAALVGAWVIRAWLGTVHIRVCNLDGDAHPADARRQRYIYAFWHESVLAPALLRTRVHVLISQHADGELIARICRHLGHGVVRGSSTRGGSLGLLQLLKRSRRSHLMVTPDGPRGPRRRFQLGAVYLASRSQLPIVPVGVGFSDAWRARSWDRFAIPKPYSVVCGVIGPAIRVPADCSRTELEDYRRESEARLRQATEAAEDWAARRTHRPLPLRLPGGVAAQAA
ncbi:MAG: lysophospholipid acyltransferase family protein [Gemmataceae bacterium]|nr:lysophospholipid acyltransferase family protein [Gemmataceae bacterium]MDW8264492.1 lysophospholipid acyltransferase family protein [Gemmataceae bacterium]